MVFFVRGLLTTVFSRAGARKRLSAASPASGSGDDVLMVELAGVPGEVVGRPCFEVDKFGNH